jgi:short-subunit dehydrogenase
MEKYALITGASKGIGRSIATQLGAMDYNLLLIARNESELRELANTATIDYKIIVRYLVLDLSATGAAHKAVNWYKSLGVPLSVLVNNAGYGIWGDFETLDLDAQTAMLNVNIYAVAELTHLLLPALKLQEKSYILNVASTAAYQAVPTLALYAASKSFVLSFSRATRYELRGSGVSVSCLCPGPTDTDFAHSAGMDALADLAAKFNMTPAEVAQIGLKGMFSSKAEIVPGFLNKVSAFAAQHLLKAMIERITAGLYKR